MPAEDVSDLRDVVDAINKLCETMKTSYDEYEDCEEIQDENPAVVTETEVKVSEKWNDTFSEPVVTSSDRETLKPVFETIGKYKVTEISSDKVSETDALASGLAAIKLVPQRVEAYVPEKSCRDMEPAESARESLNVVSGLPMNEIEVDVINVEPRIMEKWSNIINEDMELVASDSEPAAEPHQCEPISEMYYTASSEVSLLSDIDAQDKVQGEDSDKEKDDRHSVMAGHVAAMRERFESMTRTNTPCPDLIRSASPSFEVFRNFSTSPDRLE